MMVYAISIATEDGWRELERFETALEATIYALWFVGDSWRIDKIL